MQTKPLPESHLNSGGVSKGAPFSPSNSKGGLSLISCWLCNERMQKAYVHGVCAHKGILSERPGGATDVRPRQQLWACEAAPDRGCCHEGSGGVPGGASGCRHGFGF